MVGTVNDLVKSFMWPWLVAAHANERPIRNSLGGDRAVPAIAHCIAAGQARKDRKHLRGEYPHDVGGYCARNDRPMPVAVQFQGRGEVGDEPAVCGGRRVRFWVGAEKLQIGGRVSLARIAARHKVSAGLRWVDLENGHLIAACVRVRLPAGQSLEWLTARRRLALIQQTQHMV